MTKKETIMKYIILTFSIMGLYTCKAQNIVPLSNIPEDTPGITYYKDTDNDFNNFEGTWKWENGNSSLTIQLQKIEMHLLGKDYYDSIIGEYQYIADGEIQNNSLPLTLNSNATYSHNIYGGIITPKSAPPCNECASNTRFVKLRLIEPENPQLRGAITMGYFVENGIEKIKVRIYNTNDGFHVDYTGPTELKIPENSIFTLVKQ